MSQLCVVAAESVQPVGSSLACGCVTCRSLSGQEAQAQVSSCRAEPKRRCTALQRVLSCRVRGDEGRATPADGIYASGWDWLVKVSPGAANPVASATTLTPCGGLGHHGF